jgi:hypothetical protein
LLCLLHLTVKPPSARTTVQRYGVFESPHELSLMPLDHHGILLVDDNWAPEKAPASD